MPSADAPAKKSGRSWGWFDNWVKRLAAVVALVAAVIGVFKTFSGSQDTKTPGNFTLVTDVTVIENQYQEATGRPLTDANIKDLVRSAVNLAKAGQYEASRKLFQQLASTVPVPAVFNNLGALDAEKGDVQGAREAYQQAVAKNADYQPALQNLKKLATIEEPHPTGVKGQEHEPNNDFNHANEIAVGDKITASIADASDTDFYQFKTSSGPRDIFQVSVENGGITLYPYVAVYDGNRHKIAETNQYLREALAQLDSPFSAQSGSTYYVQVSGLAGTSGSYTLLVRPLRRYDTFEPNDDFPEAKSISPGSTIEANIMDANDADFYQVKAGGTGQLTARIDNGTSLYPYVAVYDGNRHKIAETNQYLREALAQLDSPFSAQSGSTYYVQVSGLAGTSGAYKLTVK